MQLAQDLNQINESAGIGGVPKDIGGFFQNVSQYLYFGAGILLLVYMVMGGYQIMFSKGDPKATAAGWAKISNALIGFLVIILAYTITKLLGQILGVGVFDQLFN